MTDDENGTRSDTRRPAWKRPGVLFKWSLLLTIITLGALAPLAAVTGIWALLVDGRPRLRQWAAKARADADAGLPVRMPKPIHVLSGLMGFLALFDVFGSIGLAGDPRTAGVGVVVMPLGVISGVVGVVAGNDLYRARAWAWWGALLCLPLQAAVVASVGYGHAMSTSPLGWYTPAEFATNVIGAGLATCVLVGAATLWFLLLYRALYFEACRTRATVRRHTEGK
jgi:hypothetical protein